MSVLIPCRNEHAFIGACLDSVLANDYPADRLQIIVIDGESTDDTRQIVDRYARAHGVELVANPGRTAPKALNIGISHAKGEIVMRIDAHAVIAPRYISLCVRELLAGNADNVGGIWVIAPRDEGAIASAIVATQGHPFGVGNAHYRFANARRYVDTVPWFCCRRSMLDQLGTFNEELTRGQDMEFSLRLRSRGGRTLLNPEIKSTYFARTDLRAFARHSWTNGRWAVLPFLYSSVVPVSPRHLVPLAFVLALAASLTLAVWRPELRWLALIVPVVYAAVAVAASVQIWRRHSSARMALLMPALFAILHISYGLGSAAGVIELAASGRFWRRLFSSATRLGLPQGSTSK